MNIKELKDLLLREYNLLVVSAKLFRESSDNQVWEVFTSGRSYIVRISKRQIGSDFQFEAGWMDYLFEQGIPTVPIIKTHTGEAFVMLAQNKPLVVFKKIEGDIFLLDKSNFPSSAQAKNASAVLAKIHSCSRHHTIELPRHRTIYTELERVLKNETRLLKLDQSNSSFLKEVVEFIRWGKEQQFDPVLIHGDYRTGNIIFNNNKLAAVLDFDWACLGPAIKDVAHALAEWSYPDGAGSHNESIFVSFLEAYNLVSEQRINRTQELYRWMAFSCLSDAGTYIVDRLDRGEIKSFGNSFMYAKYLYFLKLSK